MAESRSMFSALGNVEVFDLTSTEVGDTFRVFVGNCGDEPEAVLFVTDANGLFGLVVDTVRMMQIPALLPPLLVVGIGYPTASTITDTIGLRTRDLTPTAAPHFPGSGGADAFLRFIRHELVLELQRRAIACPSRSLYFGHSLGGLLGAHDLLSDGRSFDSYILSSPSLWWDRHSLLKRARAMKRSDLKAAVFLGIGALETDSGRRLEAARLDDGHPAKPGRTHLDMVDDMNRFVEALGSHNLPNLNLGAVTLPDEFHATAPATVLTRGLRFHFAG